MTGTAILCRRDAYNTLDLPGLGFPTHGESVLDFMYFHSSSVQFRNAADVFPHTSSARGHAQLGDAETTRHTTNQMKLCPR
jgi:hypothetical protein